MARMLRNLARGGRLILSVIGVLAAVGAVGMFQQDASMPEVWAWVATSAAALGWFFALPALAPFLRDDFEERPRRVRERQKPPAGRTAPESED